MKGKLLNLEVEKEDGSIIVLPVIDLESIKINVVRQDWKLRSKATVTFDLLPDDSESLFTFDVGNCEDKDSVIDKVVMKHYET